MVTGDESVLESSPLFTVERTLLVRIDARCTANSARRRSREKGGGRHEMRLRIPAQELESRYLLELIGPGIRLLGF